MELLICSILLFVSFYFVEYFRFEEIIVILDLYVLSSHIIKIKFFSNSLFFFFPFAYIRGAKNGVSLETQHYPSMESSYRIFL